jgi:HlyD family secretion protein
MNIWHTLGTRFRPATPRGRRFAAGAAIVGGAVLASASLFATGPAPEPAQHRERAWPVSVVEVEPALLQPAFTGFGRIESTRTATLRTDLVAEVRHVRVREGDRVTAGDVLIELADEEAALRLEQRRADLGQAEAIMRSLKAELGMLESSYQQVKSMHAVAAARLARHAELRERGLISQSLLDDVQAQADEAEIQRKNHEHRLADMPHRLAAQAAEADRARALFGYAELEVAKTRVRAPFDGPILAVHVASGDRSGLGTPLIEMAAADSYEVRLQLPDAYSHRVQALLDQGAPVTARVAGLGSLPLIRLASRVTPGQSGIDAFFALAPAPGNGPPALGRIVDLEVQLPPEHGVVALPVSALYENDRVYAVEQNRLEAIPVERVGETRAENGDFAVLVRSPELTAGRRVVTTQLPRAVTGLLVDAG